MIKIDDKYVIRALPDCYIAEYLTGNKPKKDKKTGKESPAAECLGYFGKVEGAVRACKNHALRKDIDANDYSLSEVVNRIAEITAHFEKALSESVGDN